MRKGFHPHIEFDKRGEIFAIATGSDACAEHECGSQPLQHALCAGQGGGAVSEHALVDALRAGTLTAYPALLDRKLINQNLDQLTFIQGADKQGVVEAVFGYSAYGRVPLDERELASLGSEKQVFGAWDDRSFAVRVVGEKLVGKLARFVERIQAGEGVFAGTFLTSTAKARYEGVVIALASKLRPEHRQAIARAQAEWELKLRLQAKSRLDELYEHYRATSGPHVRMPGYIWPVWRGGVEDGEVAYALNPDRDADAPYWGPYEFDQLKNWIVAEKKYRLTPIPKAA